MPAKAAKKSPASPSSRKAPRAVRAGTKAVAEAASGEKVPAKAQVEGGGGARGGRALVIVEEHQIDVAAVVQLLAAKLAEG